MPKIVVKSMNKRLLWRYKNMMKKAEIPKAKDNEIIVEYVKSYSSLCLNENLHLGTKQLSKHCTDLESELLRRGILTEENIKALEG